MCTIRDRQGDAAWTLCGHEGFLKYFSNMMSKNLLILK